MVEETLRSAALFIGFGFGMNPAIPNTLCTNWVFSESLHSR